MEEDIENYLQTVMFRGTPCILTCAMKIFCLAILYFFAG